jgi:hypothetical protein
MSHCHGNTNCRPPLEVAKADARPVALLVKAPLDIVTHVLQDGHIHVTHLLPPVRTGLDVALLYTINTMYMYSMYVQHTTGRFASRQSLCASNTRKSCPTPCESRLLQAYPVPCNLR